MTRHTHIAVLLVLLALTRVLFAQSADQYPQRLSSHRYWNAYGTRDFEYFGYYGLNYLGRLNDTVPNALAVYEDSTSCLIFNRAPYDTAVRYRFPGSDITKGNFNGDQYPDFVCVAYNSKQAYVLFGTPKPDSFLTAFEITGNPYVGKSQWKHLIVADFDSSGYDGIVESNYDHSDPPGHSGGIVRWWRGGPGMKSVPTDSLVGTREWYDYVGGEIMLGRFSDSSHAELAEIRVYGPGHSTVGFDTAVIHLYPLGKDFSLHSRDSILIVADTERFDHIYDRDEFSAIDVDGDGRSEIGYGLNDRQPPAGFPNPSAVFIAYSITGHILTEPTYMFHLPWRPTSSFFGFDALNLGNFTGRGYPSMLVVDWDASDNWAQSGSIYVYNIGRGLKDSCIAWEYGANAYGHFGKQVVAMGNVSGNGLTSFAIAEVDDPPPPPFLSGAARVHVFLGDTSYGQDIPSGVRERAATPIIATLEACYPEPSTTAVSIPFTVSQGGTATLALTDMLGRTAREWHGYAEPGARIVAYVDVRDLPPGRYWYRHGTGPARTMTIVR
jgi:hypothetical protein